MGEMAAVLAEAVWERVGQAVEWARQWASNGLSRLLGRRVRRWWASSASRASRLSQVWLRQAVAWRTAAAC